MNYSNYLNHSNSNLQTLTQGPRHRMLSWQFIQVPSLSENISSVGETIRQVTEVRLTAHGKQGMAKYGKVEAKFKFINFSFLHSYLDKIWGPLAETLSTKDKKLKVFDIWSVAVGEESLVHFSKCVTSGKENT